MPWILDSIHGSSIGPQSDLRWRGVQRPILCCSNPRPKPTLQCLSVVRGRRGLSAPSISLTPSRAFHVATPSSVLRRSCSCTLYLVRAFPQPRSPCIRAVGVALVGPGAETPYFYHCSEPSCRSSDLVARSFGNIVIE